MPQYLPLCAFCRIPEFKSFEELELPQALESEASKPARRTPSDLEQQPEINIEEWLHKIHIWDLQKFNVSLTILSTILCDYEFHIGALI